MVKISFGSEEVIRPWQKRDGNCLNATTSSFVRAQTVEKTAKRKVIERKSRPSDPTYNTRRKFSKEAKDAAWEPINLTRLHRGRIERSQIEEGSRHAFEINEISGDLRDAIEAAVYGTVTDGNGVTMQMEEEAEYTGVEAL